MNPADKARIAADRRASAGHAATCAMDGCESIPKCKVQELVKDLETKLLQSLEESNERLAKKLRDLWRGR